MLIEAEWRIYASVNYPSLVHIMACHLVSTKPLSDPMLEYYYQILRNKIQWNFYQNSYIFIQENPFQNVVWKMVAFLSQPQCVKFVVCHWPLVHYLVLFDILIEHHASKDIFVTIGSILGLSYNLNPLLIKHWSWERLHFAWSLTIFSCDQAALCMVQSVCLSVCLSHLFEYVPIFVSSWNFQELLPMTNVTSMQKAKVRVQRSRSQRSTPNLAVSGP